MGCPPLFLCAAESLYRSLRCVQTDINASIVERRHSVSRIRCGPDAADNLKIYSLFDVDKAFLRHYVRHGVPMPLCLRRCRTIYDRIHDFVIVQHCNRTVVGIYSFKNSYALKNPLPHTPIASTPPLSAHCFFSAH